MPEKDVVLPILSEQSLLIVAGGVLALLVTAGICFTIVLRRDPSAIRYFRRGRALHHVTILTVAFATVVLALEGILTGEAVASILGGIIGYVLGSLKEMSDQLYEDGSTLTTGTAPSPQLATAGSP